MSRIVMVSRHMEATMQKSFWGRNIYIDADVYLGLFGWGVFSSRQGEANAARYIAQVEATLRTLCSTWTGENLVWAISSKPWKVVIKPHDPSPEATGGGLYGLAKFMREQDRICNAEGEPVNMKDAMIRGTPWWEEGKYRPTSTATGVGSDCVIPYSPWVFDGHTCGATVPFNRPDIALVHELVHGLACLSGRFATKELAPPAYGNLEEFGAIVVTNVYISETGGKQLAGGHDSQILPAALIPSQAFYDAFKDPLQRFFLNQPAFVKQLRRSAGTFISHNPFLCCEVPSLFHTEAD